MYDCWVKKSARGRVQWEAIAFVQKKKVTLIVNEEKEVANWLKQNMYVGYNL